MAAAGTTRGDEVRIRLRLDTQSAEADLARFQSKLVSATQRIGVNVGGAGGGGAQPGGGGVLAGLMNLGFGGLTGLGLAYAAAGSIPHDIAAVSRGTLGTLGSYVSEQVGLAGLGRTLNANQKATDATVQTLGMGALGMSEERIRAIREQYRTLYGKEAEAENRVRVAIGASEVEEGFGEILKRMVGVLERIEGNTSKGAKYASGSGF